MEGLGGTGESPEGLGLGRGEWASWGKRGSGGSNKDEKEPEEDDDDDDDDDEEKEEGEMGRERAEGGKVQSKTEAVREEERDPEVDAGVAQPDEEEGGEGEGRRQFEKFSDSEQEEEDAAEDGRRGEGVTRGGRTTGVAGKTRLDPRRRRVVILPLRKKKTLRQTSLVCWSTSPSYSLLF